MLQHENGKCAQVSSVLDSLCRRPFCDFVNFCAALISVDQTNVVVDLLSPEVQASSNGCANVDKTATDAVSADVPPEDRVQVGFDWRAVMRRNFSALTKKLDPDKGLFEKLRSTGVISDWNYDIFKVNCKLKLLSY